MRLNRAYWSLPGVKGTICEHYMLVAAQLPTRAAPAPDNDGAYFPGGGPKRCRRILPIDRERAGELVNTTMETYLQDLPSSCMACHQAVSNARGGDSSGCSRAFVSAG